MAPTAPAAAWKSGFLRWWWLGVPLLTLIAYRTIVDAEFVADAGFLLRDNLYLRDPGLVWQHATHNYFWSSSGNAIPYWRPVTKVSWWLEYQAFGSNPAGFMLVQLAWHVVGVIGVQRLGRRLGLRPEWAIVAAALFALHPVARDPVCMLMARSDVVGVAAAIWAVLLWVEFQQSGKRLWLVAHWIAFALALLSKETAIVLPLVLAGHPLTRWRATDTWRSRLAPLIPGVLTVGVYLVLRRLILRSDAPGMEQVSMSADPLRILASLSSYLHGLWPFALRSTLRDVPIAEARSAWFLAIASATLSAAGVFVGWAWRRRDRTALWLVGWWIAALLPVLLTTSILVPGSDAKYVLADRWLFHGLAPAALVWAWVGQSIPWNRVRVGVMGATAVWSALILWDSRAANAEFITEAGMLDNEDRVFFYGTPEEFRTQQDWCRFEDRRVVRALMRKDHGAVVEAARAGEARCGTSPERAMWLLDALVAQGRWTEAAPVALDLLRRPPIDRRGHASLFLRVGTVLLKTGHPLEAEQALMASMTLGLKRCETLILLAEAARALSKVTIAAQRLEGAFDCGGQHDASLLLAASTVLAQNGELAEAKRLLQRAGRLPLTPSEHEQAALLGRATDGDPEALEQLGMAVHR